MFAKITKTKTFCPNFKMKWPKLLHRIRARIDHSLIRIIKHIFNENKSFSISIIYVDNEHKLVQTSSRLVYCIN